MKTHTSIKNIDSITCSSAELLDAAKNNIMPNASTSKSSSWYLLLRIQKLLNSLKLVGKFSCGLPGRYNSPADKVGCTLFIKLV